MLLLLLILIIVLYLSGAINLKEGAAGSPGTLVQLATSSPYYWNQYGWAPWYNGPYRDFTGVRPWWWRWRRRARGYPEYY